ncbi:phage/plasmid primase, P4 family [Parafrankia sp. EAN1pec]|uniref:phage/plasmid primase, P4 family n=1 Tax=Parafrankia sp. (strain EAN1pec) TaxID=298653 RepID=UPI00005444CF|nr:phage/plasmid primase, P4 family [Frankia sp. EAN1pec]
MTTPPLERFSNAYTAATGWGIDPTRAQQDVRCPAHEDGSPSLSVGAGHDGRVLLTCQAGCDLDAILAAVELATADLFPPRGEQAKPQIVASYPYTDEQGTRLFTVHRKEPGRDGSRKEFVQQAADGSWKTRGIRKPLYRLPEVVEAVKNGAVVWVVEGEKDADRLASLSLTATTCPQGARKWKAEHTDSLSGAADVRVIADNDDPGRAHAAQVEAVLRPVVTSVSVWLPAAGKDVSDHLNAGHGLDDLRPLAVDEGPAPGAASTAAASTVDAAELETDDANALRLVAEYGNTIRRVSDMGSWWRWTGKRWERDHDDAHVREAAKILARKLPAETLEQRKYKRASLSSTGLSGATRVAQSDPRVTVLARDLDAHPHLLNTQSGVVDLVTGAVKPHDPWLMLTRITPLDVDTEATHPMWSEFLAETFGGDTELVAYVQSLCGLALLGDVREHVLPLMYGAGANGKGVILLVLQGLLGIADTGGYSVSAPDGFLMAGNGTAHPTEIARLRGARLVVCSEQTSGRRFDEAKVKRLTGGDLLTGRFMRGDFFDFEPSHLTVVATNHLPEVIEGGPSFWRRARLIPFDHVVPPERRDTELHTKLLSAEGPAILGWMVRGAMIVIGSGLVDPPRVLAATDDYRISEDSLASFVRDDCIVNPHAWCTVPDFRTRYEAHCAEMGVDPLSAKAVTTRLTREFPVQSDRLSRPSRRIYRGIGLVDADAESDEETGR